LTQAWLNYSDLAAALGTTAEAVRQRAIRCRWRRQQANDGRALVLIDVGAEKAANAGKQPFFEALQVHVATLHAELDKAEALAAQRQAETEAARKRVDELVTELFALSQALAERARLAERPWWRRWRGASGG
jgi:hypothetical protein